MKDSYEEFKAKMSKEEFQRLIEIIAQEKNITPKEALEFLFLAARVSKHYKGDPNNGVFVELSNGTRLKIGIEISFGESEESQ